MADIFIPLTCNSVISWSGLRRSDPKCYAQRCHFPTVITLRSSQLHISSAIALVPGPCHYLARYLLVCSWAPSHMHWDLVAAVLVCHLHLVCSARDDVRGCDRCSHG